MEIYDDLGGLSALKQFLGPSTDMKNIISEGFSWMDYPANFEHLFNEQKLAEALKNVKKEHGFKAPDFNE